MFSVVQAKGDCVLITTGSWYLKNSKFDQALQLGIFYILFLCEKNILIDLNSQLDNNISRIIQREEQNVFT